MRLLVLRVLLVVLLVLLAIGERGDLDDAVVVHGREGVWRAHVWLAHAFRDGTDRTESPARAFARPSQPVSGAVRLREAPRAAAWW